MKLMAFLFATSAFATPALAQHAGHSAPSPAAVRQQPAPAPDPTCAPEHAAMGHCTPKQTPPAATAPQASKPVSDPSCPPEHAAMGHCTPKPASPAPDPHAGHAAPPAQPADPHAGHDMQAKPSGDPSCPPEHAAMGHCTPKSSAGPEGGHAPAVPDPPVAPPSAAALGGPRNAADQVYGSDAMSAARTVLRKEHGDILASQVLIDRLEIGVQDGAESYAWDAQAWYGGDINRLWLKSEGEGALGDGLEGGEVQALYSRSIDPWFNLHAGVRQDFGEGPDRTHLVLGIQGLARYWFEVDGALFLSTKGDLTGRLEAEYDQRLTQKLILQPNIEFDLAAQDVPELGIGAGLTSGELGLRLRYQFVPEFAPYVGVKYERSFGRTADFARARGEDVGGVSFVIGLRTWF